MNRVYSFYYSFYKQDSAKFSLIKKPMEKFVFVLKNEKTKNHILIRQLLVFFNFVGFVFLLVNDEERIGKNLYLLFAIVISAAYIFFAVIETVLKKTSPNILHRTVFWLCASAWLKEGYWWLSILLLAFVLFDILAHRKLMVTITDKKITLPSLPQKEVEWNELSNLVLKDELLTIDFKNNKLLQHIIFNDDEEVDENVFNKFCSHQLNK